MPTCQNCHYEWTWSETFRKSFTLDSAMTCPHCGNKQYITKKSRKRSSLTTFIAPLILLLHIIFSFSPVVTIGLLISACIIIFISYPFIIQLSNEKEPLW